MLRDLARLGLQAVALLALMFAGSVALWVGIPIGWLWVGSQVQGATGSVGAAIGAMIVGVVATVAAAIPLLGALTRLYQRARVARGLEDTGAFPLEVVLTLSCVTALGGYGAWFLTTGSSPIPVQVGF